MLIVGVHYEDLTLVHRDLLLNGCGAQSGVARWFDAPELLFHEACNRHDFDYRVGGERDMGTDSGRRLDADSRWYTAMLDAASLASWWNAWWYRTMAWSYYRTIRAAGAASFTFRESGGWVTLDVLLLEEQEAQQVAGERALSPLACAMCASGKWHRHGGVA